MDKSAQLILPFFAASRKHQAHPFRQQRLRDSPVNATTGTGNDGYLVNASSQTA
jgi:hypothetical protein